MLLRPGFYLLLGGMFFSLSGATGCSSARMSDYESDRLFRVGKYEEAAARLGGGLKNEGENGRDSLLFLLDIGLSLHSAGKYEESNQAFLKADKLADIKDYTSLSQETATLFTTDNLKTYKGEDFEKVLINTYLAMNFALMGDYENALVEARRVNQKLYLMVSEGKRKYKQNAFTRYLSAILYEANQDYNDAYIDYKNTWKLIPTYSHLGRDLWRCAYLLRMPDEMEQWDQTFKLSDLDHQEALLSAPKSAKGEIIILYENGISPQKRPNPQFSELPQFFPRPNPVMAAEIEVNGQVRGTTLVLENIEATAIQNLDEKYAGMIAKKVAGVVAKEAVGYGVAKATDSPLVGLVAKMFLYASDQADLRSWNLLPRDLQIARIAVNPGTYSVKLKPLGQPALPEKIVQVERGKKRFMQFRYIP